MSPTDETDPDTEQTPDRGDHERADVDTARIVWGALTLLGGTAVSVVVVAGGYAAFRGIEFTAVFQREVDRLDRPLPPQPRLENDPSTTRRKVEAQAIERLQTWEWVGKKNQGVARIPIDRAMEIVVQQYQQEKPPAGFLGAPPGGHGHDHGGGGHDQGAGAPDAGRRDAGADR
ncbi:MAG: hypothetical protein ABEN55_05650 [Bradymonadaceae bacterium]